MSKSLERASQSAVFAALFPRLTIFPLRPIPCTCPAKAECGRLGKHPAVMWNPNALKAGEKLTDRRYPGAGYGIATGARSCLFVVDLDGLKAVRAFYAAGPVPETFTVCRDSEHAHLYFRWPGFPVKCSVGAVSGFAPGVDVRGDGGFIVGPGSPHKSGALYHVAADIAVADAPAWLLAWEGLRKKRERIARESPRVRELAGEGADLAQVVEGLCAGIPKAWRIARAKAWLTTRPPAVAGEGGDALTWRTILCAVKTFCLTDVDMGLKALAEWNARCVPPWGSGDLARNIARAIESRHVAWNDAIDLAYTWETR